MVIVIDCSKSGAPSIITVADKVEEAKERAHEYLQDLEADEVPRYVELLVYKTGVRHRYEVEREVKTRLIG